MKKNILFVVDEMTMGGVARILNNFLKLIDRSRYSVDLLILHRRGELLIDIPDDIRIIDGTPFFNAVDMPLQIKSNLFSKLRLLMYMKTGLIKKKIQTERSKMLDKRYDIEFSAKEGFCTIFTAYGDSKRKINWVQVDYKLNNYARNHMGLMKDALQHIDMNISSSITSLESFKELFGINNICLIHNLIDEERIRELASAKPLGSVSDNKINLITVARFHPQKAIDRLIRVFAKLKDYYTLTIVGDGELKSELYALAKNEGVFEDMCWLGIQSNPYADIRQCDLFVMSSIYEGYPTVTVETLVSGTPVLTTAVAGVDEQLFNEEDGWIVDNSEEALFDKLKELKDQKELLRNYKQKLLAYHYNNEAILEAYYRVLEGDHE